MYKNMTNLNDNPKKKKRIRPSIHSDERILERDKKLFEREKASAIAQNKDVMRCQCDKCKGGKDRAFRTVERHLRKNGRYFWSRVFSGQQDRDSSDGEWEAHAHVNANGDRVAVNVGHDNDSTFASRSEGTCTGTGHRPTGYAVTSERDIRIDNKQSPTEHDHDQHTMHEPETRFHDMIYDIFHKIDEQEEAGFQEEILGMIDSIAEAAGGMPDVETTNLPEMGREEDVEDDGNDDPLAEFEHLLQPLFPGATQSTLEFIITIVNLCTEHRVPQIFINALLCLLRRKSMLKPNNVPESWYKAKAIINKLGLNYVNFDACIDGCVLFRKEFADLSKCPKCSKARYKENTKIPVNRVRWFPLIPRLQRMFRCPSISELLTWAFSHRTNGGLVYHAADSKQWKFIDRLDPEFAKDPRFLHLALMLDGVNPFQVQSVKHSMWPIMVVNYNLPPWLTTKRFFVMLSVLVSGTKSISQSNIDVYLEPLYEELNTLWSPGVRAVDCHARNGRKVFNLRAVLMWTINDYPALGYISGLCTGGNLACSICGGAGPADRGDKISKSVYLNARCWLPPDHPWRTQAWADKFTGFPEFRGPPARQSAADIQSKAAEQAAFDQLHGKRGKRKRKGDPYHLHGVNRRSALFNLPYWPFLPVRHCIDVMHMEKNICENIIGYLLGLKDTKAVRDDMEERGIRPELWAVPIEGRKKFDLPQAPYSFTDSERDTFMRRLKSMKVPDGYCGVWNAKVELHETDPRKHKLFGLKSHDYHVLMQQLLPVCIRGLLSDEVRDTIIALSSVFQRLCRKDFDPKSFPKLMSDTVETLCRLEMCFPPAFFDPMTHLLIHAVEELEWCGPVHTRWMYFGERALAHFTRYSNTRANVGGSIAACYVREESFGYMTEYMRHMTAYDRRIWDEDEDLEVAGEVLKGGPTSVKLTEEERLAIHHHILDAHPDIQPFRTSFEDLLDSGEIAEGTEFRDWLWKEVPKYCAEHPGANPDLIHLTRPPPLIATSYNHMWAYGSHYRVLTDRSQSRPYYNSGVSGIFQCPVNDDEDSNETVEVQYVGELTQIIHLLYKTREPVIIMKSRWVRPPHPDRHPSFKRDRNGFLLANFKQMLPEDEDPYVFPNAISQVFYLEDESRNSDWRVVMKAEARGKRMYQVEEDEPEED